MPVNVGPGSIRVDRALLLRPPLPWACEEKPSHCDGLSKGLVPQPAAMTDCIAAAPLNACRKFRDPSPLTPLPGERGKGPGLSAARYAISGTGPL